MHKFSKGFSESTDGMVFVVVNDVAEESGAFSNDKGGREIRAVLAFTVICGRFTTWADGVFLR